MKASRIPAHALGSSAAKRRAGGAQTRDAGPTPQRIDARPGASGLVKCRWCRGLFERPAALPAHVPATVCRSLECRARQRAHDRELAARRAGA